MTLVRRRRISSGFARIVQPVDWGQRRGGYWAAVLLLGVWQLAGSAPADEPNPGFSENDYFRLEWDYDLLAGTGLIKLTPDPQWDHLELFLETYRFNTKGLLFDVFKLNGLPAPFDVSPIGDDLYEYALRPGSAIRFAAHSPAFMDVEFPAVGVGLYSTDVTYDGFVNSGAGGPLPIPLAGMNFVSIQTIPEPPAAAVLVAGAAAAVYARRRRNRAEGAAEHHA